MPHHLGAAAAVITACVLSRVVNQFRKIYYKRLLPRNTDTHWLEECIFVVMTWCVTVADCLGLGRKTELTKVRTGKKLRERLASKSRTPALAPEEGKVLVETIVSAEDLSIWAMLMPECESQGGPLKLLIETAKHLFETAERFETETLRCLNVETSQAIFSFLGVFPKIN